MAAPIRDPRTGRFQRANAITEPRRPLTPAEARNVLRNPGIFPEAVEREAMDVHVAGLRDAMNMTAGEVVPQSELDDLGRWPSGWWIVPGLAVSGVFWVIVAMAIVAAMKLW